MEEININDEGKIIEKDISKQDISSYEKRKKLTNQILMEAVTEKGKTIKLIYDKENKEIERFKLEATPMLKECGIKIRFE